MLQYILQPLQVTLSSGELHARYLNALHAARNKANGEGSLSIGQDSFNTGEVLISQDEDAAELQFSLSCPVADDD